MFVDSLRHRYVIVDYERSNFSVNPCVFLENAPENIFLIPSVDASNENSTNTSNGTSFIGPNLSLSGWAVVCITVAAVLVLLTLSLSVTLIIIQIRRRRRISPFFPRSFMHEWYQNLDTFAEFQEKELGFLPNEFQRTRSELDDRESSNHEAEETKYSRFSQDSCQEFDQYRATMSTCEVESAVDISLATSPSSLGEQVTETTKDSDHVVTSPHSATTNVIRSQTDNMPSFDVLEEGHWTLEMWQLIAENIRIRYRDIMGVGNPGSINLLACSSPGYSGLNSQNPPPPGSPAVCISCKDPDRVNRDVLQEILGPLKDLPIIIGSGSVRRSGYEENCWCAAEETCLSCQGKTLTSAFENGPAAYGRYMQKPDCGASIGVDDTDLEYERVSLGGYVSLLIGSRWFLAAVTCHHLIDRSSVQTLGIQSRAGGTGDDSTPGVRYSIQSSAKIDHDGEVKRLRQRIENSDQSLRKIEAANIQDAYKSLVNAQLRFGEARCSSGISIDAAENLQVYLLLRPFRALVTERIADTYSRWTGCSSKTSNHFELESTSSVIQHRSWKARNCVSVVHDKSQRSTCPKMTLKGSCDSVKLPWTDRWVAYPESMAAGAKADWETAICPGQPVSFALVRWNQPWNGLSSLVERLAPAETRAHGFSPSLGRSWARFMRRTLGPRWFITRRRGRFSMISKESPARRKSNYHEGLIVTRWIADTDPVCIRQEKNLLLSTSVKVGNRHHIIRTQKLMTTKIGMRDREAQRENQELGRRDTNEREDTWLIGSFSREGGCG